MDKLFAWLSDKLGIEGLRKQSEWQYRQIEEKFAAMEKAVKDEQTKVYMVKQAPRPNGKAVVQALDYETSQIAALEEFKES